jgi:SAM-dependent methyltransferase
MQKISYLIDQSLGFLLEREKICPNCGGLASSLVDRKYLVSQLRMCAACGINFRWPCDKKDTSSAVYQDSYLQPGLTTDLPQPDELAKLKEVCFRGSEKDFSSYVQFAKNVSPGNLEDLEVLDYGANWGYLVYQLRLAGIAKALGYEVSFPRRAYGEAEVGVAYIDSPAECENQFDFVISTHVIEHVPMPSQMLQGIHSMLKPGGTLLLECPNGSLASMTSPGWSSQWGEIHPFYISDGFLLRSLGNLGFSGMVLDKSDFLAMCESMPAVKILELANRNLCSRLPISSTLVFIGSKPS